MKDIAICVVAYNRAESLKRLLVSLSKAKYDRPVCLYISIDYSERGGDVVDLAGDFDWENGEKIVIRHTENLGLRKHILKCGDFLNSHDALIVLEDDVVVSPDFFRFADKCVDKYYGDDVVAGISLYSFIMNYHNHLTFWPLQTNSDVYMMQNAQSWGQVWMKPQWAAFKEWYDMNNEEFTIQPHLPLSICGWPKSSWLKYHTKYCIENKKYFIYPYKSFTTCFSDAGVHTRGNSTYSQTPLCMHMRDDIIFEPVVRYDAFFENENILENLKEYSDSLCVDFYGEKANREKKRYWLTRLKLPYKIIKSYSMEYKPYELNVILDNFGEDIFLYDTSVVCGQPIKKPRIDRKYYFYLFNIPVDSNGWELFDHLKAIVKDKLHLFFGR